MRFEQSAIGAGRCLEPTAHKAGHDLAQDGGVIFRLCLTGGSFDAKLVEILAQARERTLVQKTGQIVGFRTAAILRVRGR